MKAPSEIRTARQAEVKLMAQWAAAEGWNPGLADAVCFLAADAGGFLMGYVDDEPVSCISVVKYGENFGFLGFYIVRPEFRGRGFGLQIWQAGMARLQGRNVGLDGVVDQQDNYRKSGFRFAYRNMRFMGKSGKQPFDGENTVDLKDLSLAPVNAYDRPFFPARREEFVKTWVNQRGHIALGQLEGGTLTGYGVIRPCLNGYKIGPLFADSSDIARNLYHALNAAVPPGQAVFLDIPELNPEAVKLVEDFGLEFTFETARMYTDDFPKLPLERLFGVTTFELG